MDSKKILSQAGFSASKILLPNKKYDMNKWATVACDQFTSEPEYWNEVYSLAKNTPSTAHLMLPEAYLESVDFDKSIDEINSAMQQYIETSIFEEKASGFIYVEREVNSGEIRKGIVTCVDLEKYDYSLDSKSRIRATEKTVIDRLPPRVKIRKDAPLEMPHIMILIDDPENLLCSVFEDNIEISEKVYDFSLMQKGGNIKGYYYAEEDIVDVMADAITNLFNVDTFKKKYQINNDNIMSLAVGDGNHSLASAKVHWENVKQTLTDEEKEIHPARFALVEVVNIHDKALEFEPIHRIIFDNDIDKILDNFSEYSKDNNSEFSVEVFSGDCPKNFTITESTENSHVIGFVTDDKWGKITVKNPYHTIEVGTLQVFLDWYSDNVENLKVDYIHGSDTVKDLTKNNSNAGFILPVLGKSMLFKAILHKGVLPRKSFSMGHAEEKRYYLECRKIK